MCAVYYREWEYQRGVNQLKEAIAWAFGSEKKGGGKAARRCGHAHRQPQPDGGVKCVDCGEVGY